MDERKGAQQPSPPQMTDDTPLERPPSFAAYDAEYFYSSEGNIISHDHHLNEDGEALYRFLLAHSAAYPTHTIQCTGSHLEHRTRQVTRTVNGTTTTRTEHHTVTIPDFNFTIDLTNIRGNGPVHWSYGDFEPAYRGLMVRQVDAPQGRRKATKEETASFKAWEHERDEKGYPPWSSRDGKQDLDILQSSHTLRQWADEYCASPKYLKEFVYEKYMHNWNLHAIAEAVRGAIRQTNYGGDVTVLFSYDATKICIRADNRLSRMLSKTWIKVLLCIFLIYPFIWLFKRYHSRGGGRWEVCGGAYTHKYMVPLDGLDGNADSGSPHLPPRIIETKDGPMKLYGLQEGEWFRRWEGVIKRSVSTRLQSDEPMREIEEGPVDPREELDGYVPGRDLDGY